MSIVVIIKEYKAPNINKREILRYMGVRDTTEELESVVNSCLNECISSIKYKLCFCTINHIIKDVFIDFGFTITQSKALADHLKKCDKCILFAATLGIGLDRLIAKYSRISPAKALCFQAIGAERIEALCDIFEHEIEKEYGQLCPRFSPGYADFDLSFQRELFRLLDCQGKIGLTLNSSLIMSPSKSVTGVIGIKRKE